jgi:protein-tyrosine-phosphatase
MPVVLFVCTANRFRSLIAEAEFTLLLKRNGQDDFKVWSAGTWTQEGLPPVSQLIDIAEKLNLKFSHQKSRQVTSKVIAASDLVLVMEKNQKESLMVEFPQFRNRIFLLTEIVGKGEYDIPDPIQLPEESCLEVAKEIVQLVKLGYKEICKKALAHDSNAG